MGVLPRHSLWFVTKSCETIPQTHLEWKGFSFLSPDDKTHCWKSSILPSNFCVILKVWICHSSQSVRRYPPVTQYTIEIKLEAKALLNNAFFLWNPCWSHVKWNKSEMNDFKTRLDIFGRVFTSLKLLKRHKEQTSWFRILSKFNGTCCFVAPVVAVIFQTPWKFAEVERRLK